MRFLLVSLIVAGGCSKGPEVTADPPSTEAQSAREGVLSAHAVTPSTVIYTTGGLAGRTVLAMGEDGLGAPATLSAVNADGAYAGALPGRRALIVEGDGTTLQRVVSVSVNGRARQILGDLPAGAYSGAGKLFTDGADLAIELKHAGAPTVSDVASFRNGRTAILARDATLVAVAAGRAAVLAGGALRSYALDGTAPVALGAGAGDDQVAEVRGADLLVNAGGDVHAVSIDGARRVTIAATPAAESGFGFAASGRVVWTRRSGAAATIFSSAADGSDARPLAQGARAEVPVLLMGDTLLHSNGGALFAVPVAGGPTVTVDPALGGDPLLPRAAGNRVIYSTTGKVALSLRSARIDGGGVTVLCEHLLWLPFASAVTSDGRVIFHRALAGQPEGGGVFSVRVDGTELEQLAAQVELNPGQNTQAPADQDFEAVTPGGKVILEAEFEGALGAQLFTALPQTSATRLTPFTSVRFAALIP